MRRVVLDANVYVSALLAPAGSPAQILEKWADDQFDVIVSPLLLAELKRVLRRRKFSSSIPVVQVDALLSSLSAGAHAARVPQQHRLSAAAEQLPRQLRTPAFAAHPAIGSTKPNFAPS